MDLVEVLPQLHMFRFPIGQAYLWRDGADLTLIDTGDINAAPAIEDGVRSLGLDPGRISRIVITHGHIDHYGAAQELADRHGAEIMAHRLDAAVIRGEEEIAEPVLLDWELPLWEHTRTVPPAPPTRVDRELADGDELGPARAPGWSTPRATPPAPSESICRTTVCCSPGTAWPGSTG